jgi:Fe-Mn family superoxide dismutase
MTNPEEHISDSLAKLGPIISYDDFSDLATSVAHIYSIPLEEATQLIHKLRGDKQIGSQEFQNHGFGKNNLWQGQNAAHGFGSRPPGDLAEPKSSLGPLSKLELFSYKKGDIVRVVNNTQAPWGGEYKGVIEHINAQDTFDIRDLSTGVLNVNQPAHLLRNPLGEGRPDVRVQQRRVGDPKGMGESQLDSGDINIKREYPANSWMPAGQSGKDVKNQQSNFYKEADMNWWPFKSKKEKEHEQKKTAPYGYKVGDTVTVAKSAQGNDTWVDCHCGRYRQGVKPGHPGQFYYPNLAGSSGTILRVFASSHEGSGFSFNCYDVLMKGVGTYHLNDLNLEHANALKIKVEEPSKDKLDDLKDRIRDAETAGNKELAKQLLEQYLSLTSTKKDALYSFLIKNIVKEYGETSVKEVERYLEGKISTPSRTLCSIIRKYNLVISAELFTAKNYDHLLGLPNFSDTLLKNHFKLYEGYVKSANKLRGKPKDVRQFEFEFNGMRLHELYFDAMTKASTPSNKSKVAKLLAKQFGSYDKWLADFKKVGETKGPGWIILYQDGDKFYNCWIAEHATGHLTGAEPLLVADMWEHAYTDYGIDRAKYVEAFFNVLDWKIVDSRVK